MLAGTRVFIVEECCERSLVRSRINCLSSFYWVHLTPAGHKFPLEHHISRRHCATTGTASRCVCTTRNLHKQIVNINIDFYGPRHNGLRTFLWEATRLSKRNSHRISQLLESKEEILRDPGGNLIFEKLRAFQWDPVDAIATISVSHVSHASWRLFCQHSCLCVKIQRHFSSS